MAGSAISTFTDFWSNTGPAYLTSAEEVVNEAVRQDYELLNRLLRGADMAEVVQGGRVIRDVLMFDEENTAEYYSPNQTFTWANPQVTKEWEVEWRYLVDHAAWTDQEIEHQAGDENYTRTARHQVYKRIKRIKEQRLWTSIYNKIHDQFFAEPEQAKMETSGGTDPYSIPAFINEDTGNSFLFNAGGDATDALTTVQGLDSSLASNAKWRNALVTYTTIAANPPGTGSPIQNNIIAAFDEMFLTVKFRPPATKQQYFEEDNLFRQGIYASKKGQNIFKQLQRATEAGGAVAVSTADASYHRPQYAGIDVIYAEQLDTARLYDGTAIAAEMDKTAATAVNLGPRYYWINANYLRLVWHARRYMKKHPVMTHPNQPFTHVAPCDSWYNLIARSRQRHGIVSPSTDHYSLDS